jgi:hypothetical protein
LKKSRHLVKKTQNQNGLFLEKREIDYHNDKSFKKPLWWFLLITLTGTIASLLHDQPYQPTVFSHTNRQSTALACCDKLITPIVKPLTQGKSIFKSKFQIQQNGEFSLKAIFENPFRQQNEPLKRLLSNPFLQLQKSKGL